MVSNHHKNTLSSFQDTIWELYTNTDAKNQPAPLIREDIYNIVQEHAVVLDETIDHDRDYMISFFGFMTLLRYY